MQKQAFFMAATEATHESKVGANHRNIDMCQSSDLDYARQAIWSSFFFLLLFLNFKSSSTSVV